MQWYAVNTKAHQESQAEQNLKQLGVEIFCPKLKRRKVRRRQLQTVINPFFPGYIFARFCLDEHYGSVKYARGVRKIVTFGTTPARVEEELIQAIKSRMQNGYVTVISRVLTPGQVVRINDGPFSGLEAVFEREMTDQQRVVLLLRALAYQARVVVPLEQVANS